MKQESVSDYLEARRIKWAFNVERAPWWGRVLERFMIRKMTLEEEYWKSQVDV